MAILDDVILRLTENNVIFSQRKIDYGVQLTTIDGVKINVYTTTNRVEVQGKLHMVDKYRTMIGMQ